MNATRAATTKAGSRRKVLSLGRVQTPTLALIVNRDLAIARVRAPGLLGGRRPRFDDRRRRALHAASGTQRLDRPALDEAEPAEAIAAAASGADGAVVESRRDASRSSSRRRCSTT